MLKNQQKKKVVSVENEVLVLSFKLKNKLEFNNNDSIIKSYALKQHVRIRSLKFIKTLK
jgi:hypothetical protein